MARPTEEALIAEQDAIVFALASMKKNAPMYSSGTELFRSFRRLEARHAEIQRQLDAPTTPPTRA